VSAAENCALLVGMIRVDSVEYEEGKLLLINSYYNEDAAAAAHSPVLRALAVSKQTNKANGYACASRRFGSTASHARWRRAGTGRLLRPTVRFGFAAVYDQRSADLARLGCAVVTRPGRRQACVGRTGPCAVLHGRQGAACLPLRGPDNRNCQRVSCRRARLWRATMCTATAF
jgi:hypothetical protein